MNTTCPKPFLEVLQGDSLGEFLPPEVEAMFQGQPDTLQEEHVLESAPVLQVVRALELRVQVVHAERHRPLRQLHRDRCYFS